MGIYTHIKIILIIKLYLYLYLIIYHNPSFISRSTVPFFLSFELSYEN